jgi:exosome complex component RRP41
MGGYGDMQMIDENGLRVDGRSPGDIRDITIETGVIPVADGSCRMTWGTNEAIVAVYGPMEAHPRKIQRQDRAVLDVAYNMAPFSTTDRMRPGFNRRSREISKVTKDALESVVLLELYPNDVVVCDLNKEEDNYGEADLPMGILPNSGELVFLQMDGDLSQEEFKEAWQYNMDAAQVVHKMMVEALKRGDSQ